MNNCSKKEDNKKQYNYEDDENDLNEIFIVNENPIKYELIHFTNDNFTDFNLDNLYLYNLPKNINILSDIKDDISNITDKLLRNKVLEIILTFQKSIIHTSKKLDNIGYLSPLKINKIDENTIIIEWIFKNFRIGFVIEIEINKSSWYIVSDANIENIDKSGLLQSYELNLLIDDLIDFVINNT